LNLVRVPEQVVDPGAEVVLVAVVLVVVLPVRAVAAGVEVTGKHWEYPSSPMLPSMFEE
jgi:hypothetical protein